MSKKMLWHLVIQALFRATSKKHPDHRFIAHSNQGSQYCAHDYQKLLQQLGMIASMSCKGDCYDNVPRESFWEYLKPNWCIIEDSKRGNKPFIKLLNISKYSKTDSASKRNWAIYCPYNFRSSTRPIYYLPKPMDSIIDRTSHFAP